MSLFDDFAEMQIDVTPVVITSAPGTDGEWVDTPVNGTPFKGIIYNLSATSQLYGRTWAESVTSVLVCKDVSALSINGQVIADGVTYNIEAIEDPGHNNVSGFDNVYNVGLAVLK